MKNSFVVQYATHLLLASMGAKGFFAVFIGKVIALVLGEMLDRGIIELDIKIDKLGEALRSDQWRAAALKAYQKASSKIQTEAEKDEIRKEYLAALNAYARFQRVSDYQNP